MNNSKIIAIISEFRSGATKKQIHKKYGDIGLFAVNKFCNQKLDHNNLFRTLNYTTYKDEDDKLKEDIFKRFFNGEKEKEIYKLYGEYGRLILDRIKELISVPPL